jgi:uncharacterized Zn finger protein (UPF0148 family)
VAMLWPDEDIVCPFHDYEAEQKKIKEEARKDESKEDDSMEEPKKDEN